jgi:hypothetical protein
LIADGEALRTTPKQPGGITGKGFMPGISGNPGGRPRGLASYVQGKTRDGQTLVDFAVDLVEGKLIDCEIVYPPKETGCQPTVIRYQQTPPARLRLEAAQWLADRGWGKAIQEVAVAQGAKFVVRHLVYPPGHDPLAGEQTQALAEREVTLPRWR